MWTSLRSHRLREAVKAHGHFGIFCGGSVTLLAVAVSTRLYQLGLPSARDYDEGVYWQTLRSMTAGAMLYRDIFYSQPPLFMLSTFPGYLAFGSSLFAARLAVTTVSLLGLLGAFLLGKALAGRAGAIAALLLMTVNPAYLAESQTLQAEASSVGLSFLAVAFAYMWWRHQSGVRGYCYAGLTGATLTAAVLCKLLAVAASVPVSLMVVARLWQIRHDGREARVATLRATIVGVSASALTLVVILWPLAGALGSVLDGSVTYHLVADRVFGVAGSRTANLLTLEQTLDMYLVVAAA